jgi:hypothetical protein
LELIKSKFRILPTWVSQALPLLKFTKVDADGNRELETKWQTVLDGFPSQLITAAKIQELLDENPDVGIQDSVRQHAARLCSLLREFMAIEQELFDTPRRERTGILNSSTDL